MELNVRRDREYIVLTLRHCCIVYQIYSILLFPHSCECAFAQDAQNICYIQGIVSLPFKMVKNYVIKSVKNLKVYGNLVSLIK